MKEKLQEIKKWIDTQNFKNLTSEEKGIDNSNQHTFYAIRKEDYQSVTAKAASNLLQDLLEKKFLDFGSYSKFELGNELIITNLTTQAYNDFEKFYQCVKSDLDKQLDRNSFTIETKIKEKAHNAGIKKLFDTDIFFSMPKHINSLTIDVDKKINDNKIINSIGVISDFIGKELGLYGRTFQSAGEQVISKQNARINMEQLIKNKIKISATTYTYLGRIDYSSLKLIETNVLVVTLTLRNLAFVNFGNIEKVEVPIQKDMRDTDSLIDSCIQRMQKYFKVPT